MATITIYASSLGDNDWTNPTNAYSDDTVYATCTPLNKNADIEGWWGFDFSAIDSGATINQVKIEGEFHLSSIDSEGWLHAQAYLSGSGVGDEFVDSTLPTTDKTFSHDPNYSFSRSDLNNLTMWVLGDRTQNDPESVTFYLDYCRVYVDYTGGTTLWGAAVLASTATCQAEGSLVHGVKATLSASAACSATGETGTTYWGEAALSSTATCEAAGGVLLPGASTVSSAAACQGAGLILRWVASAVASTATCTADAYTETTHWASAAIASVAASAAWPVKGTWTSDYLAPEVLDHCLGKGARSWTPPASLYLSLHTAQPTSGNELSGNGYQRQATRFGAASGNVAVTDTKTVFNQATSAWSDVTHWALWDAASSGNMLLWGPLKETTTIASGKNASFAVGEIRVTAD